MQPSDFILCAEDWTCASFSTTLLYKMWNSPYQTIFGLLVVCRIASRPLTSFEQAFRRSWLIQRSPVSPVVSSIIDMLERAPTGTLSWLSGGIVLQWILIAQGTRRASYRSWRFNGTFIKVNLSNSLTSVWYFSTAPPASPVSLVSNIYCTGYQFMLMLHALDETASCCLTSKSIESITVRKIQSELSLVSLNGLNTLFYVWKHKNAEKLKMFARTQEVVAGRKNLKMMA